LNKSSEKKTADFNTLEETKEKKSGNINCAVVIPSLNPIPDLPVYVEKLIDRGVPEVIIVNDGSKQDYDGIFREMEQMEHCTVLKHNYNRGKGRALKTAFSYFIRNFSDMDGVVTADADGQHSVDDVIKICNLLTERKDVLLLGVRNFKENNVPKRSYIGNMLTSNIFHFLYGCWLNDTQTGLRGIPSGQLSEIIKLKGERYDFEINMLIYAKFINLGISTIPIDTLYFDNNSGSHYNTFKDSAYIFWRLISGLIKYYLLPFIKKTFKAGIKQNLSE